MAETIEKNNVQIEIYRDKKQELIQKSLSEEEAHRKDLCEKLGFWQQARRIEEFDPGIIYHEITSKEMKIWRAFLPTKYPNPHVVHWKLFDFDTVPLSVMEEIDFAKKTGLFRSLEIWTPEKLKHSDPVVVGISNSGRTFLIARWGESLIPFEDIRKKVRWAVAFREMVGEWHFVSSVVTVIPIVTIFTKVDLVFSSLGVMALLMGVPCSFLARLWLRANSV